MIKITADDYVAAQAQVVAEVGEDYVYPDNQRDGDGNCYYVSDGAPACIAARTLARLGIPISTLRRFESVAVDGVLRDLVYRGVIETDEYVPDVARAGQIVQDGNLGDDSSWGAAQRNAVGRLKDLRP